MRTINQQQGVSLIEVLVSMVIFSVGILGMSTLQTRVLQENIDQQQRDVAIWKAQAIIDRINLNKTAPALAQYVTDVTDNSICDAPPATFCAATNGTAADECDALEMATYDSWDVLCTNDQGAADVLNTFDASLVCAATPCVVGSTLTLQFLWRSLTALSDPRIATTTIDGNSTLSNRPDVDGYIQVFTP
jgi:type IV pilus assembly protein PilV